MTYEIRHCGVSEILANARAMFDEHWEEICVNKEVMQLDPNEELYYTLEDNGSLVILGAFDGEELVGYSVNVLNPHLHYAGLLCMNNDLLFVSKDHRSTTLGMRLITRTEQEAKQKGAQMMMWHCKPDTALQNILERRQYNIQDIIYSREV